MKNLNMLVWLTQLGLSVALPPVGFILLAVWLQNRFGVGDWVLWCAIVFGIACAVDGLRTSLKAMQAMAREKETEPPVAFNEHD